MKKLLLILLPLLLLTGCAPSEAPGYRQISAEDAMYKMQTKKDYIILDVRTRQEFNDAHIPGAICIPNETIGSEELPELPDKEQLILVYCRSGNRSKQAAQKLADLGYTNVYEFGGIIDWPGEVVSDNANGSCIFGAVAAIPVNSQYQTVGTGFILSAV